MRRAFLVPIVALGAATASADPPRPFSGEVDPLEVRPSLVQPRLSIPNRLITVPVIEPGEFHVPPSVEEIPTNRYGDMIHLGRRIFTETQIYAKRYVGNGLNCSNCHLQEGRRPFAAPLWASYPMYPMYRFKNSEVVTFQERVQDCFRFSLDGIAPTIDAPEIEALTTYAHWLSTGVPINTALPGRGFVEVKRTRDPTATEGEEYYMIYCSLCHGEDGLGQKREDGSYMFPPLWGSDSFNRAAGLNQARRMAQFIRGNMPPGAEFTLDSDKALAIASYIWVQARPYDPRHSMFRNMFMRREPGR